ncbi:hypothetical protein TrVE_jg10066 [Triparma verrucosa]|uniref:Uncharacterized protein n=1 Tax=Triparma verrucosa TaxID=1606542 RepID=A0A9W7DLE5_9STRA|nr:hypothetical protein TrVE_jg10066 [Triparma verrucosa]
MDDFISSSIQTLLRAKEDEHDPIDLLRSINSISKTMMDTLSLRESLLRSDPAPWTAAVAKHCSVPTYTKIESLDGSTRIKAKVIITPNPKFSGRTAPITLSFDYERRPHELPSTSSESKPVSKPVLPTDDPTDDNPIRPLSYNKGTMVMFTVTAADNFDQEVPLIILEIEGKRDRPLKDCVSREDLEGSSDSDEEDENSRDPASNKDTYAVFADGDGMDLLRQAFEGACSPEEAEDLDDESLIYSILTFGFYDTEWDVPRCIVEGLFGSYSCDSDDDDDSNNSNDSNEQNDSDVENPNATPLSVDEGSLKDGDFEMVN